LFALTLVLGEEIIADVPDITRIVPDAEIRLSALDVDVAREVGLEVVDEHEVGLGRVAAVVADGQQARLVLDQVAQGLVVRIRELPPWYALCCVLLLLGLERQLDEDPGGREKKDKRQARGEKAARPPLSRAPPVLFMFLCCTHCCSFSLTKLMHLQSKKWKDRKKKISKKTQFQKNNNFFQSATL